MDRNGAGAAKLAGREADSAKSASLAVVSRRVEHPETCSEPGCSASFPGSKFDAIRAHNEGWFFQQDGKKWCPLHVPDWVPAWREKQKQRKVQG